MNKGIKLSDVMSVKDASLKLKISKTAVHKAIIAGKIKVACDMGGSFFVLRADVKKYKKGRK